jgi:hypothetical protein
MEARNMTVYSIDVNVHATLYVRADNPAEAMQLIRGLESQEIMEIPTGDFGMEVSGLRFDDPNLPKISLSPAMTVELEGISEDDLDEADSD